MKLVTLVVLGTALATANVTPVFAQSSTAPGSSGSSSPNVIAAAFTAEVTGEVKSVDPQSGMMTLQTVDGPVNVRFPAAAVKAIKPGDQVTVAFGLLKPPPSASPQTAPPSKESK
jgi:Cu/Ag efflux protein CusF